MTANGNVSHCYSVSNQAGDEWVATIKHLDARHPIRQAATVVHFHKDGEPCQPYRHTFIKAVSEEAATNA